MKLYQNKYRIATTRLQNWDYGSPGLYFVTINTKNREKYFGEIAGVPHIEGVANTVGDANNVEADNYTPLHYLHYSEMGLMAIKFWCELPLHFPFVVLDEYIIMDDHLHGILFFDKPGYNEWNTNQFGGQSENLASVIRAFKSSLKRYANQNNIPFEWQSRYYDRIVRNENELNNIRRYIIDNTLKEIKEPY